MAARGHRGRQDDDRDLGNRSWNPRARAMRGGSGTPLVLLHDAEPFGANADLLVCRRDKVARVRQRLIGDMPVVVNLNRDRQFSADGLLGGQKTDAADGEREDQHREHSGHHNFSVHVQRQGQRHSVDDLSDRWIR